MMAFDMAARKRFQRLLSDASPGRKPWEPFTDAQIASVARQLNAADVADIIDGLHALAQEKDEVPAWDGDTLDDIAKTQEIYSRILGAAPDDLLPAMTAGLQSANPQVRDWVTLALNSGRAGKS